MAKEWLLEGVRQAIQVDTAQFNIDILGTVVKHDVLMNKMRRNLDTCSDERCEMNMCMVWGCEMHMVYGDYNSCPAWCPVHLCSCKSASEGQVVSGTRTE